MRIRDVLGFLVMAVGISGGMLGHHWFGPVWFWAGAAVMAAGMAMLASGGMGDRLHQALRAYRGPGDHGSQEYHGGHSHTAHSDGGGDNGD